MHELLSGVVDRVGSVLFVEGEGATGIGLGFGEFVTWLHFKLRSKNAEGRSERRKGISS